MDIKNTIFVNQAFASAQRKAESYRHEFIMPEHLLSAIIEQEPFIHTLQDTFYNYVELSISLENYLTEEVDTVPDNVEYELGLSVQLSSLLQHAYTVTEYSSAEELDVPHLIQGLLQLEDSWACHFLKEAVGGDLPEFLSLLITHYEEAELAEEAGGTPSPDETYCPGFQIGFQHVGGIHRAFARASGAYQVVYLVDVDDGVSLTTDAFHDTFQPLLEIAAILCACQ